MATAAHLERILMLARRLSALEKVRLIEQMTPDIERELLLAQSDRQPRKSLWGLWADLGPAPAAEEIDQARREAWQNFPRTDV